MNLPETVLGVAFVMLALVGCRQATEGALFTPERGGRGTRAVTATARVMAARVRSYSLFSIGFYGGSDGSFGCAHPIPKSAHLCSERRGTTVSGVGARGSLG